MTPAKFRAIALSFEGAYDAPHFDRTAFRTKRRIFATLKSANEAMVRVPEPTRVEFLLENFSDVFFSYGGFTRAHGSLGVNLPKAKEAMLRDLLTDAWKDAGPKPKKSTKLRRP